MNKSWGADNLARLPELTMVRVALLALSAGAGWAPLLLTGASLPPVLESLFLLSITGDPLGHWQQLRGKDACVDDSPAQQVRSKQGEPLTHSHQ